MREKTLNRIIKVDYATDQVSCVTEFNQGRAACMLLRKDLLSRINNRVIKQPSFKKLSDADFRRIKSKKSKIITNELESHFVRVWRP